MHVPQKSLQSPLPSNETTLPPQHPSHHVAAAPTAGRPYQHSPFATSVAAASHPHHSPFATSTMAAATAAQHQGRLVLQQQVGLITSDCDLVAEARATNASSSSPETWKSFHQLSSKREDQLSNLSQTHPPQQHPHALLAAWEQHQQQQQPGFHQIQLRGMNQVQLQAYLQYLTAKRIQAVARQSKGLDAVQSAAVNTEDYLGNSSAPPSTSRHEQLARHSAIAEQMSAIPEQQQQQQSVMRSAQQQALEQTSGGSHLQYAPPPLQPYFKPQLTSASGGPESTRSHPNSSSSQGDTFHIAMKLQAATSNNSLHNPYSSPFQPSPGSHMAEVNAENRMKPLNESRNMASSFITPVAQKPGPLSQVQVQARRAPQMQRIISSNKDGGAASSSSASQQYLTPMSSAQAQSALTESHSHQPQSQPSSKGYGFTPQQLLVLKSQIYAFRHLKRGGMVLPPEVLQSIGVPPPPNLKPNQVSPTNDNMERFPAATSRQGQAHTDIVAAAEQPRLNSSIVISIKEEAITLVPPKQEVNELHTKVRQAPLASQMLGDMIPAAPLSDEPPVQIKVKSDPNLVLSSTQSEQYDRGGGGSDPSRSAAAVTMLTVVPSDMAVKKAAPVAKPQPQPQPQPGSTSQVVRLYRGPLYDFPPFGKKMDGVLSQMNHWGAPLTVDYDVMHILIEEGTRVVSMKRMEKLQALDSLFTFGGVRKLLHPGQRSRLKIEQKQLRLMELQSKVREEVEGQQHEIMGMNDRLYRKFVRQCKRQRVELAKQVLVSQRLAREKHMKSLSAWRKRFLETHWAIRDSRTTRNRGVAKIHERMLREFSKRKDEDRNKRMEALKNNDVDTYREMLKQKQTQLPGEARERFEDLSSFLAETEEYLQKLGSKISDVKNQQERDEVAVLAAAAARAQGLSEEEVAAAASLASEEVEARNQMLGLAPAFVNKYYSMAHSVKEHIVRQPSMLQAGILRDYQLVGLQWMLSLYNNRLNGILADEMGLGKTVQVMALIAYLMEFKGNYGPHLIIVPNAVIVNWKSELLRWLPSVSVIFYVGAKDQRTKLYTQEVCAMKFNVLVTTYEFVMRDRAKLSKVDWKYMVIDEAQRMKDRESRLARDLDRFRCQRRLLLTGTPLQNDLQELWSLLNLLLPEVFDSSKSFNDWFATPFQKDGCPSEDDWLATEKKVIVIHRLHQILEPFMLRRRVEDVEGSLPPKVCVVLRCRMSALQAAIYDWIKATGTIRLDPEDEAMRVARGNGKRQARAYAPLQNKCMELRKVCNHPFLNYPSCGDHLNDFIVRACGKLWTLDRILVKLERVGHRVLLFSTMTKLLDILEEYLQWRGFMYRRIDGATNLEAREAAIEDFNKPDSDCFIFLLSIRAAGRGLNLQSADTVVIYDPDPNPKNEEQAVARAHRIGQKHEVKVIYMEAVVEAISSYQKEDEHRCGGMLDLDDELAGKDRYMGSVESLVRSTIQQYKIDMADEVINAGRFDQRTTQEERRMTLEALLHDEDRYQERVHDVPTIQEVNRMIARSEEEVEFFDQMDEDYEWPGELLQHMEIPKWLRVGSREVDAAVPKPTSKKYMTSQVHNTVAEEEKLLSEPFDDLLEKKRLSEIEREKWKAREEARNEYLEEEVGELGGGGRDDMDTYCDEEEEGEIHEDTDEDENDLQSAAEEGDSLEPQRKETDSSLNQGAVGLAEASDKAVNLAMDDEDDGRDDGIQRIESEDVHTPLASQKFASLAALDDWQAFQSEGCEVEEGEIVTSGDSPADGQLSESWAPEREDAGDREEQEAQPRTKRKRSVRHHCKQPLHKLDDTTSFSYPEKRTMNLSDGNRFPGQRQSYESEEYWRQYYPQSYSTERQVQRLDDENNRNSAELLSYRRSDQWEQALKRRQFPDPPINRTMDNFNSPQSRLVLTHNKMLSFQEQDNEVNDTARENLSSQSRGGTFAGRMLENTQRKCKVVLQKLQAAVSKDGKQIATLFELPKRNDLSYNKVISNPIDARIIEHHLDRFEYGSAVDFAADVQLMLDNAARYYNSPEVTADTRRLQATFFQRMGMQFPDVDFSCIRTRSLAMLGQHAPLQSPRQQGMEMIAGSSEKGPQKDLKWARTDDEKARQVGKRQRNDDPVGSKRMHNDDVEINNRVPVLIITEKATQEANKAKVVHKEVSQASGGLSKKGGQKEHKKEVHKESKKMPKDGKVKLIEKIVERDKVAIEEDVGSYQKFPYKFRHPLDLVFCKKKRMDRDQIARMPITIAMETDNRGKEGNKLGGSMEMKKSRSSGDVKLHCAVKGTRAERGPKLHKTDLIRPHFQKAQGGCSQQPGNSNVNRVSNVMLGTDYWLANPIKKMRTDGGKRRPSHP